MNDNLIFFVCLTAAKAKRVRVDLSKASLERNFITPVRAMSDFLLKPADLEGLRKTKRRSPIENEPPIVVYWRKDVESRLINGSYVYFFLVSENGLYINILTFLEQMKFGGLKKNYLMKL